MTQATASREARGWEGGSTLSVLAAALGCMTLAAALLPLQSHSPDADELFYFGVLRSLYFDGDVDLRNEADHSPWLREFPLLPALPDGRIANPFPFGSTLMWAPFYAAADASVRLRGGDAALGFSADYRRAVCLGTSFWVLAGLLLLRSSALALGASRGLALALPACVLLTTPLVGYVIHAPFMAHGNAFFMCSGVLWLCVRTAKAEALRARDWSVCGLAVGLAFCVRWQDALLGLMPMALIVARPRDSWRDAALPAIALAGGAVLGALPQLAYWRALHGSWLVAPLGPGFLALAHVEPAAFLFSTWNGALSSHPVLLAGLIGLLLPAGARAPWASARWLRPAALVVVLAQIALCMAALDWWAGGAFGQRRLVSILPLLALGGWAAAARVERRWPARGRCWLVAGLALLTAWNLLALVQLRLGVLPYNPADPAAYEDGARWSHWDHASRARLILLGRSGTDPAEHPPSDP